MPVHVRLKDASCKGAKEPGRSSGYVYTHDRPEAEQEFLPERKDCYNPKARKAAKGEDASDAG